MSEFFNRKMRTYFALFDYDKDGVISKEDWMKMPALLASFEQADKKKADYLAVQFENLFEQYFEGSDSPDRKLTPELLTIGVSKHRDGPELKRRLTSMIYAIFDLMDVNCDGYLDEDEYRRLFHQCGIPDTSYAKETFRAIDTNHDGKLSFEEFASACWDFYASEDETSPNRLFFGPLVD